MRIKVQSDGRSIKLILPTNVIFSRIVARMAGFFCRRYASDVMENMSSEALEALFAEIRRIKKKHGSYELVSVEEADGGVIRIVL